MFLDHLRLPTDRFGKGTSPNLSNPPRQSTKANELRDSRKYQYVAERLRDNK